MCFDVRFLEYCSDGECIARAVVQATSRIFRQPHDFYDTLTALGMQLRTKMAIPLIANSKDQSMGCLLNSESVKAANSRGTWLSSKFDNTGRWHDMSCDDAW